MKAAGFLKFFSLPRDKIKTVRKLGIFTQQFRRRYRSYIVTDCVTGSFSARRLNSSLKLIVKMIRRENYRGFYFSQQNRLFSLLILMRNIKTKKSETPGENPIHIARIDPIRLMLFWLHTNRHQETTSGNHPSFECLHLLFCSPVRRMFQWR